MSHPAQQAWMDGVARHVRSDAKRALDVGSYCVNGHNRAYFHGDMIGVDLTSGPNVDLVSAAHLLTFRDGYFDVIYSCEAFEHDAYLPLTLLNIVRMLASGGLFAFTCASTGRAEHGTILAKPQDAPGLPWWHYRNVTEEHIRLMLQIEAIFERYEFNVLGEDLRFWGIKR